MFDEPETGYNLPEPPDEYNVSCGLVICGIYYVEVCSLYAQFFESFNHGSQHH